MMKVKFQHKAMEKGCENCHDVHGSNLANEIIKPVPDLCITCHQKIQERAVNAKYKHSVVMSDSSCQTCHTPHGSDIPKLMNDLPAVICMKCHKDPIPRDGKPTVAAVSEVLDPNTHKHGSIKDGQCSGCHDVHGGDRPELLVKVYNKTFYQRFSPENYALCFTCHDPKLVTEEQTSTATAFRNGTRNLHFVHANSGDRDKSCSVCHSAHASLNPRILRDNVTFGTWQMPIRYRKTDTGGNCYPGCHATWAYDREHPVPRPTTSPTSQPALVKMAAPRFESEKPRQIRWTGTSVSNAPVVIPDANQPTLLLFLGNETDLAKQIIASLQQNSDEPLPTKAIVFFCGPSAQSSDRDAVVPKNWPIVADPEYAISRKLNVVGWPTTILVGTDSTEIARIAGGADSLSVRLRPYLEFAHKRIDSAALDRRLASHPQGSIEVTTKQLRDLQNANHLLASGKSDAAYAILKDQLDSGVDSMDVKLAMIDAMTQTGRGLDALDLLKSLPPDAISADQRDIMAAKSQIALLRWDEAQQILSETVRRNPACIDAHFLLGQIYEHANDWQNAAREYRAMRDTHP
jgi:predicted CXXCH cytochrome family protein